MNLIINLTVVPITQNDIVELSITSADTPGDLKAALTYEMKLDTGEDYQRGSHSFILSAAQRTAVLDFINGSAIPAANTAEGLTP